MAHRVSALVTGLQTEYDRSLAFLSALEQSLQEPRVTCSTTSSGDDDAVRRYMVPAEACGENMTLTHVGGRSLQNSLRRFFSRKEYKAVSSGSSAFVGDTSAGGESTPAALQTSTHHLSGGRTIGTMRRSSLVVPGADLQDCCVVACSPASATLSGGHAPVSALRVPSRASSFLGLLPTQRPSSPMGTAAAVPTPGTPYSSSSLAAVASVAANSRPTTSPVTLASQNQWGGAASFPSSPAAAASSTTWTPPAPAAAGPDSRCGSIVSATGGGSGVGEGLLPAVAYSASYRRAIATDELLSVTADAAALTASGGPASPVPPGALSAAGSSAKFRRVSRLLATHTTTCDGSSDKLGALSWSGGIPFVSTAAHAAGVPPQQSPVPVSPAAAAASGTVHELSALASPLHAAAALGAPTPAGPVGVASAECGGAPSPVFTRTQQLLLQVKTPAPALMSRDVLSSSPVGSHTLLAPMAFVGKDGGGGRPLSATAAKVRRSSLVALPVPDDRPPQTQLAQPASPHSQDQAQAQAQAHPGSPGFRRVRRPPSHSESFRLISTSASYTGTSSFGTLAPTPPPAGPLGVLSPYLPVCNGGGAGTADGGPVAAAAAAAAPSVPPQPGSAARPPPPRRMSFRVVHGAAALQALSSPAGA